MHALHLQSPFSHQLRSINHVVILRHVALKEMDDRFSIDVNLIHVIHRHFVRNVSGDTIHVNASIAFHWHSSLPLTDFKYQRQNNNKKKLSIVLMCILSHVCSASSFVHAYQIVRAHIAADFPFFSFAAMYHSHTCMYACINPHGVHVVSAVM